MEDTSSTINIFKSPMEEYNERQLESIFAHRPISDGYQEEISYNDLNSDEENGKYFKKDNGLQSIRTQDTIDSDYDDAGNEALQQFQENINDKDVEIEEGNKRSVLFTIVNLLKYACSSCLLVFSVIVVMSLIFTNQTTLSNVGVPSVASFILFWLFIVWLSILEGGQGALVGLQHTNNDKYKQSQPKSYKCTSVIQSGNNMERFILGRQFLVVLVVFVINILASTTSDDATVLNIPSSSIINTLFIKSNVALIFITIVLGQLTSQIIVANNYMLDFINNYAMIGTTYLSLGIESSGILHSVYLVQLFFKVITAVNDNQEEQSTDEGLQNDINKSSITSTIKNTLKQLFFTIRVLLSLSLLGLSLTIIIKAIIEGRTTSFTNHPAPSILIFFLLMIIVGFMEGIQIALFAVMNQNNDTMTKMAKKNYDCIFQSDKKGNALQSFLIGRQICVTICMFIIARITTIQEQLEDEVYNTSAIMNVLQMVFVDTGILSALSTTILSSLIWRIIASTYPILFLSNPILYVIIKICLFIDSSLGICSCSEIVSRYFVKYVGRYKPDEVYLSVDRLDVTIITE